MMAIRLVLDLAEAVVYVWIVKVHVAVFDTLREARCEPRRDAAITGHSLPPHVHLKLTFCLDNGFAVIIFIRSLWSAPGPI